MTNPSIHCPTFMNSIIVLLEYKMYAILLMAKYFSKLKTCESAIHNKYPHTNVDL